MKSIAGAAAALMLAALTACGGSGAPDVTPVPATPPTAAPPTAAPPTATTPTATTPTRRTTAPDEKATRSTGGLDVRYLDEDGDVKTLKVRSFPR